MRRIDRVGKTLTKAIAIALSFSIMFGQTIGSYADELNTVTELIEEAKEDLDTAEDINEEITDIKEITGEGADKVNEELEAFGANEETIVVESGEAIDNATIANTSDDREVAYQAKDDAVEALGVAASNLETSVAAYEQANAEYVSANNIQAAAEAELATAEAAIEDVSSNTAAAKAALDAAEAKISSDEADKMDLEQIQEQYYGEMVFFFASISNGSKAVYRADGTLDIEASAAKLTVDEINTFADNPKNKDYMFKFGRRLTELLVEYMVLHREDVNPETAEFTYGVVGTDKSKDVSGQDTVVFKGGNKNKIKDQVAYNSPKKDVSSGETVNPGATYDYKWNSTNNNNGGRENYTIVTYKDASGNEHVERYNYILKSALHGDDPNIVNGNIYVALVEEVDGTLKAVKVEDENNFSNYNDLVAAIAAFEDYTAAKEEIAKARARVAALEATLADLTAEASAKRATLETLRGALETAKEALAQAETKKEELEATYEEAKKAVEGIDLSRFAIVPVTVVNDETTGEPVVVPVADVPAAPAVVTTTPAAPAAAPVVAAPAGEEEEEIAPVAALATIDDEETPLTAGPAIEETEEKEIVAPAVTAAEITEDIEADEVPLASLSIVESLKNIWWLWILILITAITMYIIYKKNSEKETH